MLCGVLRLTATILSPVLLVVGLAPAAANPPSRPQQPQPTTRSAPAQCHPSYTGACVPIGVSDVDCEGGGGNGPFYVRGPLRVVGPDVYRLDTDGDGIACEPRRR